MRVVPAQNGVECTAPYTGAEDFHITGTIYAFMRRSSRPECVVDLKRKFQSEKVQAEICLGVTIAGIETLIGLGIILLVMK
jgi:hypothetical protein